MTPIRAHLQLRGPAEPDVLLSGGRGVHGRVRHLLPRPPRQHFRPGQDGQRQPPHQPVLHLVGGQSFSERGSGFGKGAGFQ